MGQLITGMTPEIAQKFNPEQQSHGHVIPRPDGRTAKCMGPKGGCWTCMLEYLLYHSAGKMAVVEGFNIKPGDRLLIVSGTSTTREEAVGMRQRLEQRFPDVEVTVLTNATAVQVSQKPENQEGHVA